MAAKKYALGSNGMVHAPGLIAWAINGAKFKKDRPQMIRIVSDGWGLPYSVAEDLLLGKVPYSVEGEAVVFEA